MKSTFSEIKVRGFHLDLYGHMNNARYLEVLEEARWDHFESRVDWQEFKSNRWAFVIVNININYRSPALLGDTLVVQTQPKTTSQRSVVVQQIIKRKGTEVVIADAEITFVIMDLKTQKSLPIEGRLKEIIMED